METVHKTEKATLVSKQDDGATWTLWIPNSIIKDSKIPKWFLNKSKWKMDKCHCPPWYRTDIKDGYSDSFTFTCSRCKKKGWDE